MSIRSWRGKGDATTLRTKVPQHAPTAEVQGSQPVVPPMPQVGGELVVGATPVACTPVRRCAAKATSAPLPQEIRASSSSASEAEPLVPSRGSGRLGEGRAS